MSTENTSALLFRGTVANGETKYVRLPIRDGKIGAHVGWKTTASSAACTVEMTSVRGLGIDDAGSLWHWEDSGLTFSGPAAVAAGSFSINIDNVRQTDARLKIVGAAASVFEIWDGTEA